MFFGLYIKLGIREYFKPNKINFMTQRHFGA